MARAALWRWSWCVTLELYGGIRSLHHNMDGPCDSVATNVLFSCVTALLGLCATTSPIFFFFILSCCCHFWGLCVRYYIENVWENLDKRNDNLMFFCFFFLWFLFWFIWYAGQLDAFGTQRVRPWRWHGDRQMPVWPERQFNGRLGRARQPGRFARTLFRHQRRVYQSGCRHLPHRFVQLHDGTSWIHIQTDIEIRFQMAGQ